MKLETFQRRLADTITDDLRERTPDSERRKTELAVLGRAYRTAADIDLVVSGNNGETGANSLVVQEDGYAIEVEPSQMSDILTVSQIRLSQERTSVREAIALTESLERTSRARYYDGERLQPMPFLEHTSLNPKRAHKYMLEVADMLLRYREDRWSDFAASLTFLAAHEYGLEIPEMPEGLNRVDYNRQLVSLMVEQHLKDPEEETTQQDEHEPDEQLSLPFQKQSTNSETNPEDITDYKALHWLLGRTQMYLIQILGEKLYDLPTNELINKALIKLEELVEENPRFREKCYQALQRLTHLSDHVLLIGAARQPFSTIRDLRRFPVQEWWKRFIRNYEKLKAEKSQEEFEKLIKQRFARYDDPLFAFEEIMRQGRKFLEEHPVPTKATIAQDTILHQAHLRDLQADLIRDSSAHNNVSALYRVHAIAAQCMAEVGWMKAFTADLEDIEHLWLADFPTEFMKNQVMTCFTGPWMLASLLFRSGIPQGNIFYCNVNETQAGQVGGHGTIMIEFEGELIFLDINGDNPITTHSYATVGNMFDKKEMVKFDTLKSKHGENDVATLKIPRNIAKYMGLHPNMQVMGAIDGLNAEHLMHVGLSFRHEGKFEEADCAFERALEFNPKSPQIHYYRGILAFEQNDLKNAYKHLKKCVDIFPNFMAAWYALGELAMVQEHYPTARKHFRRVVKSKVSIYEGAKLHEKAKKYCDCKTNEQMKEEWEKDFSRKPEAALTE